MVGRYVPQSNPEFFSYPINDTLEHLSHPRIILSFTGFWVISGNIFDYHIYGRLEFLLAHGRQKSRNLNNTLPYTGKNYIYKQLPCSLNFHFKSRKRNSGLKKAIKNTAFGFKWLGHGTSKTVIDK